MEAKQQRAAKENRRAEEVAALPRHSHAISFALALASALVPPLLSMPPPIIRHRRTLRALTALTSPVALTSAPSISLLQVVASRLRRAAASRQCLLSRFEEQAAHAEEIRRLAQQRLTERLDQRKSLAAAGYPDPDPDPKP